MYRLQIVPRIIVLLLALILASTCVPGNARTVLQSSHGGDLDIDGTRNRRLLMRREASVRSHLKGKMLAALERRKKAIVRQPRPAFFGHFPLLQPLRRVLIGGDQTNGISSSDESGYSSNHTDETPVSDIQAGKPVSDIQAGKKKSAKKNETTEKNLAPNHMLSPELAIWYVVFSMVLGISGWVLYTWANSESMRVDLVQEAHAATHSKELGDPCYNTFCVCLCFVMSTLAFIMTALNIQAVNLSIVKAPVVFEVINREPVQIERFPIENPGQRSFEAALGVMLSLVIACYTILYFRRWGGQQSFSAASPPEGNEQEAPVMVRTSLLVLFLVRGATLSIAFALLLEILGDVLMIYAGVKGESAAKGAEAGFGTTTATLLLSMTVVGCSEEFAKIVAVAWGTCFTPEAIQDTNGCCSRGCCRLLLTEPYQKKLALAGLAAGYGFMIVENFSYLMNAASEPPSVYSHMNRTNSTGDMKRDEMDTQSISMINWLTTFIRVACNIHPWLTGFAAARLAKNAALKDIACVGCFALIVATLPSAAVHAIYDFLLTVHPDPGVLVMAVPFFFWWVSWYLFKQSWRDLGAPPAAVATPEQSNAAAEESAISPH